METVLATHAGFCFGVDKAVRNVYDLLDKTDNICTFGPIIHNDTVVSDLKEKGVRVIENEEELSEVHDSTVVIRAHGVPPRIYDLIKRNNNECVDGTCPVVKRIHDIVKSKSEEGYRIIIIGSPVHPEVLGIKGWSEGDVCVIENVDDAEAFVHESSQPLCIVSQTTFNLNKFQELVEIIKNKGYNVNVVNTICNATKERQESADAIASKVDIMLVIGGKNSSNTQKLYSICKEKCPQTYFVTGVDDLKIDIPKTASLVGITAGASTPNNIIEEVQNYVRINF
ncbi:MAG: 4-hydroxy-3-methylbut-2-enyl diphosphate reductase [Lachnospiraceae bacterium]|nr:4-hydroxy-3-methylbut-2-enyl diphosphate reductase [Lachnospiraceae bacterium]